MDFTDEEVGWFECLISEFAQEHDWDADADPDATQEVLRACRSPSGCVPRSAPTPP